MKEKTEYYDEQLHFDSELIKSNVALQLYVAELQLDLAPPTDTLGSSTLSGEDHSAVLLLISLPDKAKELSHSNSLYVWDSLGITLCGHS